MSQFLSQSTPLIKTCETVELMDSVFHLLREEGFEVIVLTDHHKAKQDLGDRETMALDALAILRYVRQNWEKSTPVMIEQEYAYSTFSPNGRSC
jgi:hypothetical protein